MKGPVFYRAIRERLVGRSGKRRFPESQVAIQSLERRTLLNAVVDRGDYFWSDGEQIPLLRVIEGVDLADRGAATVPSYAAFVSAPTKFQVAGSGARLRLTDQVYVGLNGANPHVVLSPANGFSSFERVPGTSDQYTATVRAGAAASLDAANAMHERSDVAFAHPDFLVEVQVASTDPLFEHQWHLDNTGQAGAAVDADVDAPEAWATTTGSPDVVVAILDTGFQRTHPDLAASLFVNTGEIAGNGIDDDANGWIDDVSGIDFSVDSAFTSTVEYDVDPSPEGQHDNHATAVAGVVAAQRNNGIGGTGVAPGVKILPIKLGTSTASGHFPVTTSGLVSAVLYAAGRTADGTGTWRGADVANISWTVGAPIPGLTQALNWASDNGRRGLGLPTFAASGNDGVNRVSYPASMPSVIAVGATDHHGRRGSYSQYGDRLDFVAPGGTSATSAGWIWTTDRTGDDGYGSGDHVGLVGTSLAAPSAAGIAALMLSVDPTLTAAEIRETMRSTADRDKQADVTFDAAGRHPEYGSGWLNAAAAVDAVANSQGGNRSVDLPSDLIGREDSTGKWWVSISADSQFQTYPWGEWATDVPWVDFLSGDFNGDGRDDVAARNSSTGEIWVGLATDNGLVSQVWGRWSTTATLSKAEVGDFNGDGRADLAVRVENAGDGRWYVAESTGSRFLTKVWGGWTTRVTWGQVQTGDFNGDGLTDLAGRIQNSGDGRWVVMVSTGSRFGGGIWGIWSTAVAWDVYTGDVNGDGRTDLVTRTGNAGDGRWFVSLSTGTSLQNGTWGQLAPHLALGEALVADFTGDGMADVAVREETDGRWFVLRSTGTSGATEYWGIWTSTQWTNFVVGDFNQDGFADVAGRNQSTGDWQVARSIGNFFSNRIWTTWSGGDWTFATAVRVV